MAERRDGERAGTAFGGAPLTLASGPSNLPVHLSSFIGREADLRSLRRLAGEGRLLTVTGPGGCGKTRVAVELARTSGRKAPDGAWWVDLGPLADPSLVVAALSRVLGLRESHRSSLSDTIAGYLRPRRSLIVLDNCEHVIEACSSLATNLLRACPALSILATSREPLRIPGERVYRLAPLSLPDDPSLESLCRSEAGRLFADRARAGRTSFAITAENAPAVADVCARLDGLPLAIELAAARTSLLSPGQIAEGLADRFHLLARGTRSAPPRHRTLEASLEWSHNLLDDGQRAVFRRLAVFAGSFTLGAAEAVCAGRGIGIDAVLEHLAGLVDHSLVQVVDDGRDSRYRLLETIREYARRKLVEAGEHGEVSERHLDFYVSFAEDAAQGLRGPDLVACLARIDTEIDDIRRALDWGAGSSEDDRGMRLVGLLMLYWFARSDLSVGRARLEAALAPRSANFGARADALAALSIVRYRAGDMASAQRYGDAAVDLARRLGDAATLGRALHWRAWAHCWGENDRVASWRDFEEARAALAGTGEHVFQALNLALLAWSHMDTCRAPRARPLLEEALSVTARTSAPHAQCYTVLVLGGVDLVEGRLDAAGSRLTEALTLARQIGDHYAEIFARAFLGFTDLYRGRYRHARAVCGDGLTTALDHRSPMGEASMRLALGYVDFAEGQLDSATEQLGTSFELFTPLWKGAAAMARAGQAQVALAQSRPAEARRYSAEALELALATDFVSARLSALAVQASLARLDGNAQHAEDLLRAALGLAAQSGRRPPMCDLLEALAGALADQGRLEEASGVLASAGAAREELCYPRFPVLGESAEAIVAGLRDGLGAEGFDRACGVGAALSLDAAVAHLGRQRSTRKRATHGWESLTAAELQVVALVAEGLTNPQIGSRLYISRRTVQAHLAHIYTKLGLSNRARLAAEAAQRDHGAPVPRESGRTGCHGRAGSRGP